MSYVVIDFDLNLCYSGWMMITALFGTFGVLLALMWKRNETPTNYILLAVFVSCTSLFFVFYFGARCSSVVRAFAHGAMGRRIDPSWGGPIE